ncbi:glycosyltransferase family 4 protein [Vibrio renipiscarius]|uniref:glycosyltransferase family 4 protein n=1 Tax=Vibrio renipiscarius TaxID=1461322 RepID=UPI003553CCDC
MEKMTHKKRLVFVVEYLGYDVNSTSYYWTKILESLAKGYEVLVITPNYETNINYLKDSNFCYILYGSGTFYKSNMLKRLWSYIKFSFSFNQAAKSQIVEGDILISGTNSIFNMFFLSRFKRNLNVNWLLFGYDIFPENLVPANVVSASNPIYKITSALFSRLYSNPDDIVAVGRDMQNLLEFKVKGKSRVHYIPNWADHTQIEMMPKKESDILNEINFSDDSAVVFQFFGNLGLLQDVNGILESIKLSKAKNAKFIFIGRGTESQNIAAMVKSTNDTRVHFYGECDMSSKDLALSSCDVALVTLKKGMKGLAVPSKSYFSLAANKPILVVGDDGAELRLLVDEHPIGWSCNAGDPYALASLIDSICEKPDRIKDFTPRECLMNNFPECHSLDAIGKLIQRYN